ncbi:N-acetylglucosamine-6-phosphate deacetylase [Thalassococcus sp. BH17M4-6]|uniref:N-acetylglucosamine-6-phosphate deacetylase n=1 Tax=Thalassococcus sp. BH17M4-6 TaxID=3413148 RepID=UPI003BE7C018
MTRRALTGAAIFDGDSLRQSHALLLEGDICAGIVAASDIPDGFEAQDMQGVTLLPGFVDLQVNGGGGVMFNDDTSADGLAAIAAAHATTGTRALLPTLITDTPDRTRAAIDAAEAAIERRVPGIIGLHLEGPHLSVARKGAHDPDLIRPMTVADEALLAEAAQRLPNLMVTVAPENVTADQIARLAEAGVIVSLGHTDCGIDVARAAFAAGAACVTHLFNAMSQLGSREPGLVGAALTTPGVSAGLIADGIHVHAATIRAALDAKHAEGRIFLVTDAMSTVGSDITEFTLNGRRVLRRDGRLTLENGTLAGADLEFCTALRVLTEDVGVPQATAFAMATDWPARLLRHRGGTGRFQPGEAAHAIRLDPAGRYLGAA